VRVDAEGDYWLAGSVADVVHTSNGPIPSAPIEDALASELGLVDLAAVYGAEIDGQDGEILVAALTLRQGAKLDPVALRRGVTGALPSHQRPLVVRVLDALPLTAGQRIRRSALRHEGLGLGVGSGETLWLAPHADSYLPLDSDDLPKLLEAARES
jgi:putative long chain acyl-CoA synthase